MAAGGDWIKASVGSMIGVSPNETVRESTNASAHIPPDAL